MARTPVIVGVGLGLVSIGVWGVTRRSPDRQNVASAPVTVATSAAASDASARTAPPPRAVPRAAPGQGQRLHRRSAIAVSFDEPEIADAVVAAEAAWTAADSDPTPETWDIAADLFARAVASCGADAHCVELAYAECLARANAARLEDAPIPDGDDPVPLPARVEAMVDALDRYVELAPDSDEAPGMRFLAARTFWKYRHLNDATIARLETIVFAPDAVEVTEYSTNLLLDTLIRLGRTDALRRVVDRILADSARLAAFPDTLERVRAIRASF